ncbi:MAG: metallophosphoesterase family protein [Lysobacteraceae bacterium]
MRIGLVSDTHGLLRPQALDALRGSDHIVHAGDIGDPAILAELAALAPLTAVRGNNDHGDWARDLPDTARLACDGVEVYVLHDLKALAVDPARERIGVVVSGHSHRPRVEARAGALYVNPGSAGPRRFRLPVAVGELRIAAGRARARIIELPID